MEIDECISRFKMEILKRRLQVDCTSGIRILTELRGCECRSLNQEGTPKYGYGTVMGRHSSLPALTVPAWWGGGLHATQYFLQVPCPALPVGKRDEGVLICKPNKTLPTAGELGNTPLWVS